jgi:hypothetical protein
MCHMHDVCGTEGDDSQHNIPSIAGFGVYRHRYADVVGRAFRSLQEWSGLHLGFDD